jgi:hypothetical protein
LDNTYNEVIDSLAKEGADVACEVAIVANGEAAFRENTVELGIKESLSQLESTRIFRRGDEPKAGCRFRSQ